VTGKRLRNPHREVWISHHEEKTILTLKLFEEPLESAESQQAGVSILTRIIFAGLASLVAIVPAVVSSFTAYRVTTLFTGMTNAESSGRLAVTSGLHLLNTPLVVALGASAFLALLLALVLAVDPKYRLAAVGLPFSIGVTLIPAVPALLLWSVVTTVLDILEGRITSGPVDEMAQRISMLLMGAMVFGLLAVAVTLICAIVSLILPVSRRTDPLSLRRAFVWAVTGMLFLVFAVAYFVVV
jgi:hypothetical protein